MRKLLFSAAILIGLTACNQTKEEPVSNTPTTEETTPVSAEKIVSLNGSITEVLAALGEQTNLVGVDVTSTYPENIKETAKDLGHVRSISIENVLALKPTIVYGTAKDLSNEQIEQLKNAGIKVETIHQDYSVDGTKSFVEAIAKTLQKENYKAINETIDTEIKELKPLTTTPKVLFIYARGAGTLMVAGKNTPMEKIIAIAGGVNAVNDFEDFKPLTPEALVKSNPDYILLFDKGLESVGGIDGILKIEGVSATNAGKNKKIIAMDGQLLSGFGPRVGKAAVQLNQLIQQ